MEGRGTPLERGVPLPPNLPLPPRTSPKSTRPYMAKSCFALHDAGALGGSFFGLGGGNLEQSAAIAHGLRMGCGEERAGGAHPADCAPAGCVTCQKCYVVGNDPCVVPVWGKDTCCLQRNPTHECRDPARKSGATAALCNRFIPPETKKLPPRAPAPNKANQIFALHGRVRLGEVLGE